MSYSVLAIDNIQDFQMMEALCVCVCVCVCVCACARMLSFLALCGPRGLSPARLLRQRDLPGKHPGVGRPLPPPEQLPNPRTEPASLTCPALAGR